jgi:hypothetical protein
MLMQTMAENPAREATGDLKERMEERFDFVDARFGLIDKRFDDVSEEFRRIDSRFQNVEADVRGLRGEMNELRGDIKSMQRLMLYGFFTLGGIMLASGGIHFG